MHGFKVGWYLKPAFETRRLMWTLGHAHGTLLALLNAVFSVTILALSGDVGRAQRWASPCIMGASMLLPGGFFLGGIFTYAGDPGIGIFLVPVGAVFLFAGVLLTAVATIQRQGPVVKDAGKPGPGKLPHVENRPKRR